MSKGAKKISRQLNWEKAKRDSRSRKEHLENRFELGKEKYRERLNKIALDNNLRCFSCNTEFGPWAKSGKSNYGLWIICVECVSKKG